MDYCIMDNILFSGLTMLDRLILIITMSALIYLSFSFIQKNKILKQKISALKKESDEKLYSELRFLRHINHILRTPLNGVVGVVQLMKTGALGKIPEPYQEYLNLSLQSTTELKNALDKLEHYCNNTDQGVLTEDVRKVAQQSLDDPYVATKIPEKTF